MKRKLQKFWQFIVDKTLEEKRDLNDCKEEVVKKNSEILTTMVFATALILGVSFIVSFASDFFASAGVSNLRWAYLGVTTVAIIIYIYIKCFAKNFHTALIYIVNTLAFIYSFIVSAIVITDGTSVTFIVVLFMASTLYLDYGWRIHLFMTCATIAFVVGIYFFKAPEAFSAEAMNSFIVLALLFVIGTMVRSARLGIFVAQNTLKGYAYIDQLTGINNRRKMFEDFAKFEDPQTTQQITAFAILDVDFFKKFNDRYGHQAGDTCLKKIGNCLALLQERHSVFCYRYGGEEFTALFIDCDKTAIDNAIGCFLEELRELQIPNQDSEHNILTASVGVSYVDTAKVENNGDKQGKQSLEKMLSVADSALYKAKEGGRNMVVYSEMLNDTKAELSETIRKRTKPKSSV